MPVTNCAKCGEEMIIEDISPILSVNDYNVRCDDCIDDETTENTRGRVVADMYGPDDVAYEKMCDQSVPY